MDIYFNWFLIAMAAIAAIVFVALFFVKAGYGVFFSSKWGPSISNRWGWVIMEAPVFIVMLYLWATSDRTDDVVRLRKVRGPILAGVNNTEFSYFFCVSIINR